MISKEQLPEAMYDVVLEVFNMRRNKLGKEKIPDLSDVPPEVVNQIVEEIVVISTRFAEIQGCEFIPVLKTN